MKYELTKSQIMTINNRYNKLGFFIRDLLEPLAPVIDKGQLRILAIDPMELPCKYSALPTLFLFTTSSTKETWNIFSCSTGYTATFFYEGGRDRPWIPQVDHIGMADDLPMAMCIAIAKASGKYEQNKQLFDIWRGINAT